MDLHVFPNFSYFWILMTPSHSGEELKLPGVQSWLMEKEMVTHSSILAWRIPGTEEPGGLPSMGLHRVGHDWSDLAAAAAVLTEYL